MEKCDIAGCLPGNRLSAPFAGMTRGEGLLPVGHCNHARGAREVPRAFLFFVPDKVPFSRCLQGGFVLESMVPTGSSQRVSATLISAVMECHDEAFRLLDSLVRESGFAPFQEVYDHWRDLSDRWRTFRESRGQAISEAAPGSSPVAEWAGDFAGDGAGAESTAEVGAVRHLVELMRLGDEGKNTLFDRCGDGGVGADPFGRVGDGLGA